MLHPDVASWSSKKWLWGATAALVLIVVGAISLASRYHAARQSNCLPPGAKSLATDSLVQVYSTSTNKGSVYACLRGGLRRYALGAERVPLHDAVAPISLAGTLVAYGAVASGTDMTRASVIVLDAASGHNLVDLPATTQGAGPESFNSVSDIAVTSRGSVAWITRSGGAFASPTLEVHSATKQGAATLLDHGPQIVAGSLRLSDRTLSWQDGTRRAYAQLP